LYTKSIVHTLPKWGGAARYNRISPPFGGFRGQIKVGGYRGQIKAGNLTVNFK